MTNDSTISEWALPWDEAAASGGEATWALCIAWSLEFPERVGETARIEEPVVLGRGAACATDIAQFRRERPMGRHDGAPLADARISRRQLTLEPHGAEQLEVVNVGRCPLFVNGVARARALVQPGDVLTLQNALVLVVARKARPAPLRAFSAEHAFGFGLPDAHGIVGESPVMWALRDELALAGSSAHHVLLHGRSGSGKELAARAIHAFSPRSSRMFLSRNAATLPEGLMDAELFGNVKNYPNPGMPERLGLIGAGDGGTLFLDEIGELPPALQAHLLRVLDRDGEYQRLGDASVSKADLRIIAATNRELAELKHDFLARFAVRIALPPLETHREDIPLLIRHLLVRARERQPDLARFFARGGRGEPRVEPAVVEALVRQHYDHEMRELERLLWLSISSSPGRFLACTTEFSAELAVPEPAEPAAAIDFSREDVERAIAGAAGNVTAAARSLGLKNRYLLYRLVKRYGIELPERGRDTDET